jgi:hypothetical protein
LSRKIIMIRRKDGDRVTVENVVLELNEEEFCDLACKMSLKAPARADE